MEHVYQLFREGKCVMYRKMLLTALLCLLFLQQSLFCFGQTNFPTIQQAIQANFNSNNQALRYIDIYGTYPSNANPHQNVNYYVVWFIGAAGGIGSTSAVHAGDYVYAVRQSPAGYQVSGNAIMYLSEASGTVVSGTVGTPKAVSRAFLRAVYSKAIVVDFRAITPVERIFVSAMARCILSVILLKERFYRHFRLGMAERLSQYHEGLA